MKVGDDTRYCPGAEIPARTPEATTHVEHDVVGARGRVLSRDVGDELHHGKPAEVVAVDVPLVQVARARVLGIDTRNRESLLDRLERR
jgi:hypothetical protein